MLLAAYIVKTLKGGVGSSKNGEIYEHSFILLGFNSPLLAARSKNYSSMMPRQLAAGRFIIGKLT